MAMKRLKDGVYLQCRICSLPGLLSTHSVFIMAPVRHDFCVIAYVMERVSDRRLLMHDLWGSVFCEGRAGAWAFWHDFKTSRESRP